MSEINMEVTEKETEIIVQLSVRAFKKAEIKILTDPVSLCMDISATHCNGCKLDLQKFLDSPDEDFFHDIFGIMFHIDRKTGKLRDCFEPRCAYVTHV